MTAQLFLNYLKKSFLPEKVYDYYLFPTRVLSIEISATHIYVCKIRFLGKTVTIEACFTSTIDKNTPIAQSVAALIAECKPFDALYSVVSASLATVKILRFPFSEYEKLRVVIPHEIEPLLPFSINDAAIGFIKTGTFVDNTTHVLVAALHKHHVEQQLQYYALLSPEDSGKLHLTLDILALFSFFQRSTQQITDAAELPETRRPEFLWLLDYAPYETRLILVQNGVFSLARNFNVGFMYHFKTVAEKTRTSIETVAKLIFNADLSQENGSEQSVTQYQTELQQFLKHISFTIQSIITEQNSDKAQMRMLCMGDGVRLKGIEKFMAQQLQLPTSTLRMHDLLKHKDITLGDSGIPAETYVVALGAALASADEEPMDLLRDTSYVQRDEIKQLSFTLMTTALLALLFCILMTGHMYYKRVVIKREIQRSAQDALQRLKDAFGKNLKTTRKNETESPVQKLQNTVTYAREELQQKKELWFSFSRQMRFSFLYYLLELSTKLNIQEVGLHVEKLSLEPKKLRLQGSVKTYEALALLKQKFRQSDLFGVINPPGELEKLTFDVEIELHQPLT